MRKNKHCVCFTDKEWDICKNTSRKWNLKVRKYMEKLDNSFYEDNKTTPDKLYKYLRLFKSTTENLKDNVDKNHFIKNSEKYYSLSSDDRGFIDYIEKKIAYVNGQLLEKSTFEKGDRVGLDCNSTTAIDAIGTVERNHSDRLLVDIIWDKKNHLTKSGGTVGLGKTWKVSSIKLLNKI